MQQIFQNRKKVYLITALGMYLNTHLCKLEGVDILHRSQSTNEPEQLTQENRFIPNSSRTWKKDSDKISIKTVFLKFEFNGE